MKQQFVRIQPSSLSSDPQQKISAEEQLLAEAHASSPSTQRPTSPIAQETMGKSPASYWTREEPEKAGEVFAPPSSPSSPPRPPYGPPTHPAIPSGQRPIILQNNAPAAMYPSYGPPMQPGMPYGQRPVNSPMLQNNAPFMQVPPLRSGNAPRKKRRFPIWARVVLAVVAVLLVGGGTAFGYYQANFADPLGKITGQQAAQIGIGGQGAATNAIGNKRVNILLLGSDTDGKNAAPLAQTDIVITIDPQTNYVGMLSIPRDMRVVIPDEGTGKMDAAFSFGWQGNFGGATPLSNAAGLSIATVEKNFGIHIDYYAWVGLAGFVKVINTAGGVAIDATHPIADNSYPNDVNSTNPFAYQRLYIVPGPQHMDGVQALEYVRSRHADLVGDFGRSARQQQVLSQLKTKLDTPSIITKLPELANDLGDTVKTDMSLQSIINFMGFARNIDTTKIDRLILSPPYSSLAPDTTGDYLPNCSLITPKISQMFALGNNANCISTASINPGNTALAANQAGNSNLIGAHPVALLSNPLSIAAQLVSHTLPIRPDEKNIIQVHNLLDLMFLVTFGSLDATKI